MSGGSGQRANGVKGKTGVLKHSICIVGADK